MPRVGTAWVLPQPRVPGEVCEVPGDRAVHSPGTLIGFKVAEVGAGTAWSWVGVGAMEHRGVPGPQWGARGLSSVQGSSGKCQRGSLGCWQSQQSVGGLSRVPAAQQGAGGCLTGCRASQRGASGVRTDVWQ